MRFRPRDAADLGKRVGVSLVFLGAGLLFFAWAKTAGLGNVALQIPYVVSAACTGLGLIAVGLTVINISAKVEHERARRQQATELHTALTALGESLAKKGRRK